MLTLDGTAEPVSRDQILRRGQRQGKNNFPYSADHEQDCQPYLVDLTLAICDDHTYTPVVVDARPSPSVMLDTYWTDPWQYYDYDSRFLWQCCHDAVWLCA